MTVKELIERLQQEDPNIPVLISASEMGFEEEFHVKSTNVVRYESVYCGTHRLVEDMWWDENDPNDDEERKQYPVSKAVIIRRGNEL